MRRGWFVSLLHILMVAVPAIFVSMPAAAREPIDLWETLTLADRLKSTLPATDWRITERLVNGIVRSVVLHQPSAAPPCNDLELLRKAQIVLKAGLPILSILRDPDRTGLATVIGGNRAEFLFSCNYQSSASVFRPWLNRAAFDERVIDLMADLISDDFDNDAGDNRAAIRRCLAASYGSNSSISALCDGPAPNQATGSFFIGISTNTHKWE